jgi:hypothetical protein
MLVYILIFNARTDNEGIHTIQVGDRNTILMFKNEDDAVRYAGLLEAQDFSQPTVEAIDSEEVEAFCRQADYNWELVDDEKLAIPPEKNVEQTDWEKEESKSNIADESTEESAISQDELDRIRRQLEGLL